MTFSSATMAGSTPAMSPLREGSRCDGPDHSAVSASYETLIALPSRVHEASDSQKPARMAGEARAECRRVVGARTGKRDLTIAFGPVVNGGGEHGLTLGQLGGPGPRPDLRTIPSLFETRPAQA